MIDHEFPTNWKDLQEKVAEIFRDLGYKTEIEYEISTVRGIVEVDVFAVDETQSPNIVYVNECKYWKRRVPQTIVHSFRTIIQDYGANVGIIISSNGFQKGAFKAVRNTNVMLVDWLGFQELFEEKWFSAISETLYNKYEELIPFTEPSLGTSLYIKLDKLNQNGLVIFRELREKYEEIGMAIQHLKFGRSHDNILEKFQTPQNIEVPTAQNICKTTKIHSLREYVNFLTYWGERALLEINEVFESTNFKVAS